MARLLHKEFGQALETWHHCVTDEVVGCLESVKVDSANNSRALEGYVCGNAVLFAVSHRLRDGYFIAIFKAAKMPNREISEPIHELSVNWHQEPVLIEPVDFMEHQEKFKIRPITSVIRLQCFDDALGRKGHKLRFVGSSTATSQIVGSFSEDGEFNPAPNALVSRAPRELPSEMVEGGSQVEHSITSQDTQVEGWMTTDVESELITRLRFWFDGDGIRWWVRPGKVTDCLAQSLEVFLCPTYLMPYTVERIHELVLQDLPPSRSLSVLNHA